jgi:tetratricopeptide (TPR) repeat protein
MEWQLKPISRSAVPEALEKAERYRLLGEPSQAESICLDILEVDPDNQAALVTLLLALTDEFGKGEPVARAYEVLPRLRDPYERFYYAGIVAERAGRAQIKQGAPGSSFHSYERLREAMDCYEKAEALRPPRNDDAILRWNTCARFLMRHPELRPSPEESLEPLLDD